MMTTTTRLYQLCWDMNSQSRNCSTSSSNTASFRALLSYEQMDSPYPYGANSRPRGPAKERGDGVLSSEVLLSKAVRPPSTTSKPKRASQPGDDATPSLPAWKTARVSSYSIDVWNLKNSNRWKGSDSLCHPSCPPVWLARSGPPGSGSWSSGWPQWHRGASYRSLLSSCSQCHTPSCWQTHKHRDAHQTDVKYVCGKNILRLHCQFILDSHRDVNLTSEATVRQC